MTHPDILKMERAGYMEGSSEEPLGRCSFCGDDVYENNSEAVESDDYVFCSMGCCYEYYGIRRISE